MFANSFSNRHRNKNSKGHIEPSPATNLQQNAKQECDRGLLMLFFSSNAFHRRTETPMQNVFSRLREQECGQKRRISKAWVFDKADELYEDRLEKDGFKKYPLDASGWNDHREALTTTQFTWFHVCHYNFCNQLKCVVCKQLPEWMKHSKREQEKDRGDRSERVPYWPGTESTEVQGSGSAAKRRKRRNGRSRNSVR